MHLSKERESCQTVIEIKDLSSIDETTLLSDIISIDDFDGDHISLESESSHATYSEDMPELSLLLDDDSFSNEQMNEDHIDYISHPAHKINLSLCVDSFQNSSRSNQQRLYYQSIHQSHLGVEDRNGLATETPHMSMWQSQNKIRTELNPSRRAASIKNAHGHESKYIHSIRNDDVLFGRGKKSNNHAGNIFFRQLVSNMVPHYMNCTKVQKMSISKAIVDGIHKKGGRFLTPSPKNPKIWVEVTGKSLRTKASQALRDTYNTQLKQSSTSWLKN